MSSDIHFQALCSAVEHERIDKCKSILQASSAPPHRGVDLTALNNDGFTPLDLAFMTGRSELVRLLLDHGGAEGGAFPRPDAASAHLHALAHESKKQVDKFGQLIKAANGGGNGATSTVASQLTSAQLRECEKQQTLWQKRLATLKRLKSGFDSAGRPHAPSGAEVSVVGPDCIAVRLVEPEQVSARSLFTKCRVQWSHTDSFAKVEGELTAPAASLDFKIRALQEGKRYFVRASFGNPKGFGPFSAATPKSVVPSSWRSSLDGGGDDDVRVPRIGDHQLDVCRRTYEVARQEFDGSFEPSSLPGNAGGGGGKRRGLRHLFSTSSAPKFAKSPLAPGRAYLCCVVFHEDKVLMTNDENLPVMDVDDEGGGSRMAELHWLARLSSCWKDAERLRHEAAKVAGSTNGNGGLINGKAKLLQTVLAMQQALGVTDLGSPFHKPIVNSGDGSVILCLVNNVRNPKTVLSLSLKWVPLSKAQRRVSFDTHVSSMDELRYSLREQKLFHQVCDIRLSPGLYLTYLQALSSLDSLRLVASSTLPSAPPYVRVRDNPHVTQEEWSWVRKMGQCLNSVAASAEEGKGRNVREASSMQMPSPTTNFLANESEDGIEQHLRNLAKDKLRPTEAQYAFGLQLRRGMERLFEYLEIKDENGNNVDSGSSGGSRASHRLYDLEIIEMGPDVSMVVVFPPADSVCSVGDKRPCLDPSNRSDLLPLTLQMFESVHLGSSAAETWRACCRASLHLELAQAGAKQRLREAFSARETEERQAAVARLAAAQTELEEAWRPARWVHDLIARARDRASHCGVTYGLMCQWYDDQTTAPDDSTRHYASLQNQVLLQQQQQQQQHPHHLELEKQGPAHHHHSKPRKTSYHHHHYHNHQKQQPRMGARRDEASAALTQINAARPFDPAAPASASGTLTSGVAAAVSAAAAAASDHAPTAGLLMASKGLTRSPTTRSDPLDFNLGGSAEGTGSSGNNKENEVRNFPRVPGSSGISMGDGVRHLNNQPASSSYSSLTLSQNSTSSSLSSSAELQQNPPQYENLPSSSSNQESKRSFEPRVAQAGRFSHHSSSSTSGTSSSTQPHQTADPSVLQVFAAYETGLASGTSVRLNVTDRTSAREVVDLVIKQLNMAAILKGRDGPVYDNEQLKSFCLVAVIGNRERCLRDDFKPLHLQNPWKKGRLFVRRKNDLLAAIEHINRHSAVV